MDTSGTNTDAAGFAPQPYGAATGPRPSASRPGSDRTRPLRTLVVCAVFALLLGSGALPGVRMAIEASHDDATASIGPGRVLYTLPGSTQCRHVLFDNTSA